MKQFFILLLTSSLIIAQKTEDKFFSSNETLEAKISFTPKALTWPKDFPPTASPQILSLGHSPFSNSLSWDLAVNEISPDGL